MFFSRHSGLNGVLDKVEDE